MKNKIRFEKYIFYPLPCIELMPCITKPYHGYSELINAESTSWLTLDTIDISVGFLCFAGRFRIMFYKPLKSTTFRP